MSSFVHIGHHPIKNGFEANPQAVRNAAKAVQIGSAHDGKTVTVRRGQDLVLSLPSNATTGYKWMVVSTDRTFGYPAKNEYRGPGSSGPVGAGGTQKMTWKTNGFLNVTGAHKVTLEYRRPWEPEGPAAKTFRFTVKVVDKAA